MSDLVDLLMRAPSGGRPPLGAYMTSWDPVTYANTVSVGGLSEGYTNLPVIDPASLAVGPVLLIFAEGGPIVLGRIYRYQGGA